MNIEEKREEFSALVAVAMNVAPEQFPSWSDGSRAHMAALAELWAEIRPHLNDDAAAKGLDEKVQQLLAAFKNGQHEQGKRIADSVYADLDKLR